VILKYNNNITLLYQRRLFWSFLWYSFLLFGCKFLNHSIKDSLPITVGLSIFTLIFGILFINVFFPDIILNKYKKELKYQKTILPFCIKNLSSRSNVIIKITEGKREKEYRNIGESSGWVEYKDINVRIAGKSNSLILIHRYMGDAMFDKQKLKKDKTTLVNLFREHGFQTRL